MAEDSKYVKIAHAAYLKAEQEKAAAIKAIDDERLALLQGFADAKLIVTAMRDLEEKSGGKLAVRSEANKNQGTVTFKIREAQQHDLALSGTDDKRHGYKLVVQHNGVYVEHFHESDYFYVPTNLPAPFDDLSPVKKLEGTDSALTEVFTWAGSSGYMKPPRIYEFKRPEGP